MKEIGFGKAPPSTNGEEPKYLRKEMANLSEKLRTKKLSGKRGQAWGGEWCYFQESGFLLLPFLA